MTTRNKIEFYLREVSGNQILDKNGIIFKDIAYILVFVDGVNLFTLDFFEDSFLVFDELYKSTLKSGKYLLFTGASGIADEAGWDYIDVLHDEHLVTWNMRMDDVHLSYFFDRIAYLREFSEIAKDIANLSNSLKLEPLYVIYPE